MSALEHVYPVVKWLLNISRINQETNSRKRFLARRIRIARNREGSLRDLQDSMR